MSIKSRASRGRKATQDEQETKPVFQCHRVLASVKDDWGFPNSLHGAPRGWDQMPSIGLNVQDDMSPPVPIGGFDIDGAAQKSMASRMPKPWIVPSLCPIGCPGDAGECRSVTL